MTKQSTDTLRVSRRAALLGSIAAPILASLPKATQASEYTTGATQPVFGGHPVQRAADAFARKIGLARAFLERSVPDQETNGDEETYKADYRASFTKALPHDDRGFVDRTAYQKLLQGLETAGPSLLAKVPLDPTATRRLANPSAAFTFGESGNDGGASRMAPAPGYASVTTAAEMLELYWKALLRDVAFVNFDTNRTVSAALVDLNSFPEVVGADQHDVSSVFRGETTGDRRGPYVSQFLLKPFPYGNSEITQKYDAPQRRVNFMTDAAEWLAVQRGAVPGQTQIVGRRYIYNGRTLSEYVHKDYPVQAYLNAALMLLGLGSDFLDPGNPGLKSSAEGRFVTMGGADILDMVSQAGRVGLRAAWFQKWGVHRRLRPETYGGRLDRQLRLGEDMDLPAAIGLTEAIDRTRRSQGGHALLSQAYPEGSPTHPAYPAGHATIAGACVTVLKAFFNEDALIPNPVQADASGSTLLPVSDTLTVGGELNKLANNISLGRDWAGVHYRSDGIDGVHLGEELAIDLLRERTAMYTEGPIGYRFQRFDGTRVEIFQGNVKFRR